MRVTCSTCGTDFEVPDSSLRPGGANVPCPQCNAQVIVGGLTLDPPAELAGGLAATSSATDASADSVFDEDTQNVAFEQVSQPPASVERSEATLVVRQRRAPRDPQAAPAAGGEDDGNTQVVARPEAPRDTAAAQPHMSVSFSRKRAAPWKTYAGWGALVILATAGALAFEYRRSRPPPPPEIPNPLVERVGEWRDAGARPEVPSLEAAATLVRRNLDARTTDGVRQAVSAAKTALLLSPEEPEAVSLYATALAARAERLEPELLSDVLEAITAVIGDEPSTPFRADLESARAWLLLNAGQADAARQAAVRAVEGDAKRPNARLVSIVTNLAVRGAESIEELRALMSDPQVGYDARLWLGEALIQSGRVSDALATWREGLGRGGGDGPLESRIAKLLADLGDYGGASQLWTQMQLAGRATVEDVLLHARLLSRRLKRPKVALEALDRELQNEHLSNLSRARLVAERVSIAVLPRAALAPPADVSGQLDKALGLAPDLPELLYAAALADLRFGGAEPAIDSLEAAQTVAPDSAEVAFVLAWLLRDADRKGAAEVVATALREVPDYVPLHLLEAYLLGLEQDVPRAVAAVRRALTFDPRGYDVRSPWAAYSPPLGLIGELGRELGNLGAKLDNSMLFTAAGMAFYAGEDLARASLWLTKAVREDPNDVGARLYSALINLERGRRSPARVDLLAAERGDRRQGVVRLYRARLAEEMGNMREALKLYRDLAEQNPLDHGARVGLARALVATGDVQAGREQALGVLGTRPRDRDALRVLLGESPHAAAGPTKGRRRGGAL